jgi:hypothetical protein
MLCNAAMALHLSCLRKPIPVLRNLEMHLPKNQIDSPPIGGPLNCERGSTFLHGGLSSFGAGAPRASYRKSDLNEAAGAADTA